MADARAIIKDLLLANGGVLARRDHPELVEQLAYQVRLGRLRAVLPGVYADAGRASEFEIRARAVMAWDKDAVLVGRAAAKATFWPELRVAQIDVAGRRRTPRGRVFRVTRRRIPPELVIELDGLRCASPALTALDLSVTDVGGDAIDTALRTRAVTLKLMHEALARTPSRRGNADRRMLLLDSRDEPWSEAERGLHRILRAAGIDDFEGNWGLELLSFTYWIDVAFPKLKLAVEVDGWEFHKSPEAFERDRWRQNDLVLRGWTVLRFTAIMVRDHPEIVLRQIEEALIAASR